MSDRASDLPPGFDSADQFDFFLNDPAILQLAQELQHDPEFRRMQQELQRNFVLAPTGSETTAAEVEQSPLEPNSTDGVQAIQQLYTNPQFLQMTEKIGQTMLRQNTILRMMSEPARQNAIKGKFEELKQDPELASIMKDFEFGDPQAMMKHSENPEVFKKFSKVLEEVISDESLIPAPESINETEEVAPSMQSYAGEGNIKGLKELLKQGVDVDDKDEEGRTGLHFACGFGEIACLYFFLENGIDVNCADKNKNTALHFAAGYGQLDAVSILLKKNCDVHLKNADGNTAKDVAEMNDKMEIVKSLEVAMAQQEIQNTSLKESS